MNELNTRLRIIRTQIAFEEKKDKPDMKKIQLLKKEEQECLERIL